MSASIGDQSADDGTVMDSTYPAEAWKRLGRLLERRRGQLGYGFRQRARFAHECGHGAVSEKTLARLERGERGGSYADSTLGLVEVIYGWVSGSIERVLAGGDPIEAERPASSRRTETIGGLTLEERQVAEDALELHRRRRAREEEARRQPGNGAAGRLRAAGDGWPAAPPAARPPRW